MDNMVYQGGCSELMSKFRIQLAPVVHSACIQVVPQVNNMHVENTTKFTTFVGAIKV